MLINKNNYKEIIKDCKLGDFPIDKNGQIVDTKIDHQYYKLLCLIDNKGQKLVNFYYPFLYYKSLDQLKDMINIGKAAENNNIKYIQPLTAKANNLDKNKEILVFKDNSKTREDALLASYLVDNENKYLKAANKIKNSETNKLQTNFMLNYIYLKLFGVPSPELKGKIKASYYNYRMTPDMKKKYKEFEKKKDPKTIKEKYKTKYEFVKQYDNFKHFNTLFDDAKKNGDKYIKELKKDDNFIEYKKKMKVHDFKLPVKDIKKLTDYKIIKDDVKL